MKWFSWNNHEDYAIRCEAGSKIPLALADRPQGRHGGALAGEGLGDR